MSSNARKGKTSFPRLAVTLEHKHENLFLYSVLVSTALISNQSKPPQKFTINRNKTNKRYPYSTPPPPKKNPNRTNQLLLMNIFPLKTKV